MKFQSTNKKRETPPKFIGRFRQDGGLEFGSYTKINLKKFIRENPNMPFEIKPILPESKSQRGFFEGAICPLITFYQEGMDFHNSKDVKRVREWLKLEFNGEIIEIGGKVHKIAKSTARELNKGFLERVVTYIEENYAPPREIMDTEKYKYWRDVIFPTGKADNYLDYLIEIGLLK